MTAISQPNETLARAGIYELYSRVLLKELDRGALTKFNSEEWATALGDLRVTVPDSDERTVEDLAIDYCRIFIGPKDFCPPYQSVWESGQLQSHVVDSMNDYLESVTPRTKMGIKDHAGLQYEMMALILQFEAADPDQSFGLSSSFFRNHIAWSEELLRRASSIAQTDFYRLLLGSVVQFIQLEKEIYLEQQD